MQRKATNNTRGPNAFEKSFQAWLKDQPCAVTGVQGVDVHHCKGATYRHNKTLIGHMFCIPLSPSAHWEYHNRKKDFIASHGAQCHIWLDQIIKFESETGKECPHDVRMAILDSRQ